MQSHMMTTESRISTQAEARRVLVVDHDPKMRVFLGETLERAGFAVTIAETGEALITAVEQTRFDAVVLDKEMPDINGLDLVFFMRHRWPETPVILVSSHGGDLSAAVALGRGAARYLDKPVRSSDLVAILQEVTGRRPPDLSLRKASRVASRNLESGDEPAGDLWGVVLAGEPGQRLRGVTRRLHGAPRPRQYARLVGPHSLLRQTLDRVALEIPRQRTVVVSLRSHVRYLEAEFDDASPPLVLLQPSSRGTAAGVLLPAYWVRWRDPGAIVAVFPSDHFIPEPRRFMDRVAEAVEFVSRYPRWIVLLGAEPSRPATEYGWIIPGAVLGCAAARPVWRASGFVEQPSAAAARRCLVDGLWNTGVFVAKAATLVDAARQLIPSLHTRFVQLAPLLGSTVETRALRRAYAALPSADFSRAMLERCVPILAASRLTGVSWCDLGSPQRLATALRRAGIPAPWLVTPSDEPHGVPADESDPRASRH
jgi:mannose-1-phosphate guanylyltransferase